VRQKQLKTMAALNAIVLDMKETLREYVERFTRVGMEVQGTQDSLKCFIFESNLRDDYKFKEELGLQAPKDTSDLLARVQPYINYEEKKLVEEALKGKQSIKGIKDNRHNDNEKTKGPRL